MGSLNKKGSRRRSADPGRPPWPLGLPHALTAHASLQLCVSHVPFKAESSGLPLTMLPFPGSGLSFGHIEGGNDCMTFEFHRMTLVLLLLVFFSALPLLLISFLPALSSSFFRPLFSFPTRYPITEL